MIDLDKFLSLFYERDDPVMCYVYGYVYYVLCVLCVLRGVWCVAFGLFFLLTFGHLFIFFLSFLFYLFFLFLFFHGLGGLTGVWHGMAWDTRYTANSATGYHIYPFTIDISDNYRHDLLVYAQSVYLMIFFLSSSHSN